MVGGQKCSKRPAADRPAQNPPPRPALLDAISESTMAEHLLYQLDPTHIVAGYKVHCLSDRAALAAASLLAQRAAAVEVWQPHSLRLDGTRCCSRAASNTRARVRQWFFSASVRPSQIACAARR